MSNRNIPRDIHIKPCLNGYVVTVGCQVVVFNTVNELIDSLRIYLIHPDKTEEDFRNNALHKGLMDNLARETAPYALDVERGGREAEAARNMAPPPYGIAPAPLPVTPPHEARTNPCAQQAQQAQRDRASCVTATTGAPPSK